MALLTGIVNMVSFSKQWKLWYKRLPESGRSSYQKVNNMKKYVRNLKNLVP